MPDTIARLEGARTTLGVKAPCRVATTAEITLSGLQTIDGVVLAEGDRVLVKDQSEADLNGIRIASTASWARAVDMDGNTDVVRGTQVYVVDGTAGVGMYVLTTTDDPIEIGTSDITFALTIGADLAAIAALTTTAYGRSLLTLANAAALAAEVAFLLQNNAFNFQNYR